MADEEPGPAHGSVRYTRRRLLVLGGVAAAGVAAAVTGLRALGGSPAGPGGGTGAGAEGGTGAGGMTSFPTLNVEQPPDVPAERWVVRVDGLVDRPLTLDRAAWSDLQRADETADFHCVEGWSVDDVRWGGVAPSVLLDRAGVRPEAKYVVFHAYGGEYFSTLPLALIRDPRALLADSLGGAPLPTEHGGPLRLVVPSQLGYKNVKWVVRLELSASEQAGYWESRGYPEDAPIPGA